MKPLSERRLREIEERAAKATPGPWRLIPLGAGYAVCAPIGDQWCPIESRELAGHTAEFTAHAREDVPDLLAEVRRLRARIKAIEWALDPESCSAGPPPKRKQ